MKRFLGPLAGALGTVWTRLREWLRPGKTAVVIVAAVGCLLVGSAGTASADDATQLELWRQQAKINQLFEQRIAQLEKRVALVEQQAPTAYTPGSPPPAPISTAPSYTPPAASLPAYAARSCASEDSAPGAATPLPLPRGYYQGYGGYLPLPAGSK